MAYRIGALLLIMAVFFSVRPGWAGTPGSDEAAPYANKWIVIIATFNTFEAAKTAAQAAQPEVRVLKTDEFQGLKSGLYVLVAGKYSTEKEAKSHTPKDAYVRFTGELRSESVHCAPVYIKSLSQACESLRSCFAGVQSCEPSSKGGDFEVVQVAFADETPGEHAAFLIIREKSGWSMSELLEATWAHGGHCDVEWSLSPFKPTKKAELSVKRTCHMPLDQEELATGESDVAEQECFVFKYTSGPSGWKRVGKRQLKKCL